MGYFNIKKEAVLKVLKTRYSESSSGLRKVYFLDSLF
jgi:hypothetical protein